ncbi:hypothetical protein JY422_02180 [Stenotrophomonas maltophilia]|nr:hypothetical protein [Stenotrophomonas maltophilia]
MRLIELLADQLSQSLVCYDSFVFDAGVLHPGQIGASLPDKGKLADELRLYIGDDAFTTFVQGELNRHFRGGGFNSNAGIRPLTSYPGYEDTVGLATTLVESFCSLPWKYQVCMRLPDGFGNLLKMHPDGYELSDRHRILLGSALKNPYANQSNQLVDLASGKSFPGDWDEAASYLVVDVDGYFRVLRTEPVMSARDDIFSFIGLALAFGLFGSARSGELGASRRSHQLIIYRLSHEDLDGEGVVALDEHLQSGIRNLSMVADSAENGVHVAHALDRIGSVFRSANGKSLRLSARWLFDSHCGRDELLSYVQATVAIEILLGDEDADPDVGLTTLMANRCAYLVATTAEARAHILKAFRDIYKVRSKIVHRGQSRLNSKEVMLFNYLTALVRSVIDKEQRLLGRGER